MIFTTTTTVTSNPFSDAHETAINEVDFLSPNLSEGGVDITHVPSTKVLSYPAAFNVPIIAPLERVSSWSPEPSIDTISIDSSPPTSPAREPLSIHIQWNNADLMYLLGCIFPLAVIHNELIFDPPLSQLDGSPGLCELSVYVRVPGDPVIVPQEAFSKHAPIGTGRPKTKILLASSTKGCTTAAESRQSLAHALLAAAPLVIPEYDALAELYALDQPALDSIRRGLLAMTDISGAEWVDRLAQLQEAVDKTCVFEARLERFLLASGSQEGSRWINIVDAISDLETGVRGAWGAVYAEATRFLERAMCARHEA